MKVQLLNYQEELVNNIISGLDSSGKVGLELFTSGGKSIIGMKLIEHYVDKTGKKVMWIAPRAALNNVNTRYIEGSGYDSFVECVSLNVLSRLEKILKTKSEYKEYCLIIIDEAHRLMAKNAYEQFQKELNKFNKRVKIFAMTASSYRNLDGIRSLEEITDNGPIYKYNLSDAINDNIANPVIYYGTALEYNKRCYQALDVLRSKYGYIPYVKYILKHVTDKLKENENDTESKVVDTLRNKVKFTASAGDRHIVFFSRISELKEQKQMVENIIKKWYSDTKDINVNLIEYHGDLTNKESKEALKIINSLPKKNTVDVILTVDKGAESIHPDNMRSIILFRGTQSIVKFTQMIGRVITLTMNYRQANYVFDFCKSVSLIGANTITIGHREIQDRTDLSGEPTPEELLSDAMNIRRQLNSSSFMEINLDQTIEELNELFDRLGTMYNMLEATKKVIDFVRDKLNIIDKEYNGNVAKYLEAVNPELCKIYRKLQSIVMYQALAMGDTAAIKESLQEVLGDRIYLTLKMTNTQEKNISYIKSLDLDNEEVDIETKEEYMKKLAIQVLTDTVPVSVEKFIQQRTGLYEKLIAKFNDIEPYEFGCKDYTKSTIGKDVTKEINESAGKLNIKTWTHWRAAYTYIKYLNVNDDNVDNIGDKRYAIALQKYARQMNPKVYRYKLNDRDSNLGSRTIRILEHVVNNTISEMLPLDENFALELMQNKYNDNVFINELLKYSGYSSNKQLFKHIKQELPLAHVVNKLKEYPTESNLIMLINYMVKRGVDSQTQDEILSEDIVADIMKNVGKDGDTTLTRYCVAKLTNDSLDMQTVIKQAAKNGLGYNTIVALAFPTDAFTEVKDILSKMESQADTIDTETLDNIKSRYCRMPYATQGILKSIRFTILPKKICKAERKFIEYMA